jgi:subfamily B ATP-binding cassette protein HlyB/CyaB
LSLLVFLPILFLYSVKLTFVVVGFAALVGQRHPDAGRPVPSVVCRNSTSAEGDRQALLVETVHGMRTVKSART